MLGWVGQVRECWYVWAWKASRSGPASSWWGRRTWQGQVWWHRLVRISSIVRGGSRERMWLDETRWLQLPVLFSFLCRGMGRLTGQNSVITSPLNFYETVYQVQQPDKSTFPELFRIFRWLNLPTFPRTNPRLLCSTSGQEQRDIFTIWLFKDCLYSASFAEVRNRIGGRGWPEKSSVISPLNFSRLFCVRFPSHLMGWGAREARG